MSKKLFISPFRYFCYFQITSTEIRIKQNISKENSSFDKTSSIMTEKESNDINVIHEETPDNLNSLINSIEW